MNFLEGLFRGMLGRLLAVVAIIGVPVSMLWWGANGLSLVSVYIADRTLAFWIYSAGFILAAGLVAGLMLGLALILKQVLDQ